MRIDRTFQGVKGELTAYSEGGEKAGRIICSLEEDNKLKILHTEVEECFKGKGVGLELVKGAVAFAESVNLKIVPVCPFAKALFVKNEEFRRVLY